MEVDSDNDVFDPPPHHTGVRARHQIQRSRVAKRLARIKFNRRALNRIVWPNTARPSFSRSLDLGPSGCIGRVAFHRGDRYPGASALSVHSDVEDEDYTGNITWILPRTNTGDHGAMVAYAWDGNWRIESFTFPYKRVWNAYRYFNQGYCNFAFLPFVRELIRLIMQNRLDFKHLFAPVWLVDEVGNLVCRQPPCPCHTCPRIGSSLPNALTFIQLREILLSCVDVHASEYLQWLLQGRGHRVTKPSWTYEAITGRFQWDEDHTTYWSGSSASSHRTGGMATEFDRRIGVMLEQEKFTLLTSSVTDVTREQYMSCWRRWTLYCA